MKIIVDAAFNIPTRKLYNTHIKCVPSSSLYFISCAYHERHILATLRNVKDVFKELQAGCQSGYKKEAEAVVQPSNGQPEQSSQMHVFVQRSLADRW
ncbi:hypothetical protein Y032_0658g1252 [Ancylostoma ceylanicum]|uniref:Uncharacterized protein n=1 Tax=Ancylostoma ceylanicum TaxID=53326 RepID=A0A016WHT6_9BILA|nr:hypothetical protein Y032_0658g1252 [Ancylostoma ceylanicum]